MGFESLERLILLTNVTWIATQSGFWDGASNWSTGQVPTAADDVTINQPGITVTIRSDSQAHSLIADDPFVLSNGTLSLGSDSQIHSTLQWTGGTIGGSGTLTLTSTGRITISGGNPVLATTLIDQGTVTQTSTGGTGLQFGSSASITVAQGGLLDFQTTDGFDHPAGGGTTLVNQGTIRKSVSAGGLGINIAFTNTGGTIEVDAGTLSINPRFTGATYTSGTFTVATGATLDLTNSNNFDMSGTFTGSGGGSVLLRNGTLLVDSVGASFDFPAGLFQWTGGTIGGSGTLTNTGSMTVGGPGSPDLRGSLADAGTISQTGGDLLTGGGGQLTIASGGVYDIQTDNGINWDTSGPVPQVVNQGTLKKSAGTGTSTVSARFSNSGGTIVVASGALAVNTSGLGATYAGGTFNIAAGATLDLTDRFTAAVSGTINGSGNGAVVLHGTLNVDAAGATFNLPAGMFQWTAGQINGPGTLTNAGDMQVLNSANGQ